MHSLSMDRTAVEVCGMRVLLTHFSAITEFRHRQTLWPQGHGGFCIRGTGQMQQLSVKAELIVIGDGGSNFALNLH